MGHACVLHHARRASRHHLGIGSRRKGSLGSHAGELLLLVVHEVLLLLPSGLLWGAGVEIRSSVPKAIACGVHGERAYKFFYCLIN
jgi:hypothetical protein